MPHIRSSLATSIPFTAPGAPEPADRTPPATWCYQSQRRLSEQAMSCTSGTACGAGTVCTGDDGHVLQVTTAMLRRVLAHIPSQLCLYLETEQAGGEVSLRFVYPAAAQWASCYPASAAADLALIDALATRWGYRGNQEWHMLWAVISTSPESAAAGDPPAGAGQMMHGGADAAQAAQ